MSEYNVGKFGWIRDQPDARDYCLNLPYNWKKADRPLLYALRGYSQPGKEIPDKVDLREWSSPIETQELQDCTAHAGTSLMEFFCRKAGANYTDFSRLFLYKMTRNLLNLHGDTGATIRDTMRALAKFGVPLERDWGYYPDDYEDEPSFIEYDLAKKHQALVYYRLDPYGTRPDETVHTVNRFLAAELPSMLGFTVYSSIPQIGEKRCDIPFCRTGDRILGYHAIMLVGYDDSRLIDPDRGAFLIANSWSTDWGDKGYGWLPYRYILEGQACDIWSLVLAEKSKGVKPT